LRAEGWIGILIRIIRVYNRVHTVTRYDKTLKRRVDVLIPEGLDEFVHSIIISITTNNWARRTLHKTRYRPRQAQSLHCLSDMYSRGRKYHLAGQIQRRRLLY